MVKNYAAYVSKDKKLIDFALGIPYRCCKPWAQTHQI